MKKLDKVVLTLLIIACITWGLWGIFNFNLIDYIFGQVWVNRFIYFLFGLAGLYVVILWKGVFQRLGQKR